MTLVFEAELRLHEEQSFEPALEDEVELAAWVPAFDALQATMTPA